LLPRPPASLPQAMMVELLRVGLIQAEVVWLEASVG
jgi:hypothetical protein